MSFEDRVAASPRTQPIRIDSVSGDVAEHLRRAQERLQTLATVRARLWPLVARYSCDPPGDPTWTVSVGSARIVMNYENGMATAASVTLSAEMTELTIHRTGQMSLSGRYGRLDPPLPGYPAEAGGYPWSLVRFLGDPQDRFNYYKYDSDLWGRAIEHPKYFEPVAREMESWLNSAATAVASLEAHLERFSAERPQQIAPWPAPQWPPTAENPRLR